jgi:hypothetical protein
MIVTWQYFYWNIEIPNLSFEEISLTIAFLLRCQDKADALLLLEILHWDLSVLYSVTTLLNIHIRIVILEES